VKAGRGGEDGIILPVQFIIGRGGEEFFSIHMPWVRPISYFDLLPF
jgi:hypothetical protein